MRFRFHAQTAWCFLTWTVRTQFTREPKEYRKKGNFKTGMCGLIRYFVWFFVFELRFPEWKLKVLEFFDSVDIQWHVKQTSAFSSYNDNVCNQ